MKIVKINSLKNVGILNEDSYRSEFQLIKKIKEGDGKTKIKYSSKVLVRGDNGTGKSTISSVFRSIEEKDKTNKIIEKIRNISNNENIEIELELDDGNKLKYDSIQKKWNNDENICIKVFNEDYIIENLNLEEFSQNKIDGKYQSEEIEISMEKKEYEESKKRKEIIIEQGNRITKELKDKILEMEKKIKSDFDKYCNIEEKVEEYDEINDEKLYNKMKSELESYKNGFEKLKKSEFFKQLKINNISNNIDEDEFKRLLEYTEDSNKISFIDKFLKMNVERKEWMDNGIKYIENSECPFCKKNIENNDFINQYIKYRNSNSKRIEKELVKYKKEFENYKDNILRDMKLLLSQNREYINIIEIKEEITEDMWYKYTNAVKNLINIIDEKLKDVSKGISKEKINMVQEYLSIIQKIIDKSSCIDKEAENINKKMLNSKKELSNIRLKVKKLSKSILEYEMRVELIDRKKLLNEFKVAEENIKDKKQKYEKKLEDSDITIKEMNAWLDFFGMSIYKVNKDFNLIYKENNINSKTFILSTGEISALAFSYYLATLVVGLTEEEKKNLIIVIDDPVNSLDYNRIYSFATAIKIIQNKVYKNNNPQLIILTHNMLFFNILVQTSWMKNANAKVFELYKENQISKIREAKNYKDSLFIIQLADIIKCANEALDKITIEKSYIYNDIRSVIENFCYLLNPQYVDNDDKYGVLKEFFNIDEEEFMKVDYIVNNNSHNEPMLNIEKLFDARILKESCIVIANMVKQKFNQLYNYCLNFNKEV